MPIPTPLALALAAFVLFLLYRFVRRVRERNKTYAQLLEEYHYWDQVVAEWRYPDGHLVPQEKRAKVNHIYRQSWRRLRSHPDHPPEEGAQP